MSSVKKNTPLQFRQIKCPMCESVTVFKTLKPSSFVEKEFAIDTKPIVSSILVKGFEDLVPRHYRIAKCVECSWASDLNTFEDPVAGINIPTKTLKTGINMARERIPDKDVLAFLSRGIGADDSVPYSLIEVLKLHLLACKNLSVVPELEEKDPYRLARFALRTAWILEDIKDSKEGEATEKTRDLFAKIEKGWKGLPNSSTSFRDWAYKLYEKSLTASSIIQTSRDEFELILFLARLDMAKGEFDSAKKRIRYAKSRYKEYEATVKTKYNELLKEDEDKATNIRADGMAEVRRRSIACDDLEKQNEHQADVLAKQEMDRAMILISRIDGSSDGTFTRILTEAGISSTTISDILSRGKKKKKGFFSWLSK